MSEGRFLLQLGANTYVDVRGAVTSAPPPDAVVLPKPPGMHLDAAAVAAALRDLADPEVGIDVFTDRWVAAGQDDEFAEFLFKSTEVATIIAGVVLSVSSTNPPGLVVAVILGVVVSAFAGDDGLDGEVAAELQRIRWKLQAKADVDEADVLLAMRAEIQGRFEELRTVYGDLLTHRPTGAARLAAFEDMKAIVGSVNVPLARIRDEDWISAYDPEQHHARFALSRILRRVAPDGGLEQVAPRPDGPTRFDHRLGLPMLLWAANAYPAMLRMAAPLHRSTGSYREQLRSLAASLDRFAVRMQDECLSRTEHTAQSLFAHELLPSSLYFGSPLDLDTTVGTSSTAPDSFPVGAFDLVRYSDDFIGASWFEAVAGGGDRGVVGTFDYTWEPPAALVDAFGEVRRLDEAAVAANEQARTDHGRLLVVSGAIHLLIASAMLRYLSAPPDTSETVQGAATGSRVLVGEVPTQAMSPVIFPNVQITAQATLNTYEATSTVRCTTQEPGHEPALRYRVVLRTIDSLFGKNAWRDRGYLDWVWTPELVTLAEDPRNLELRTEFVSGRVLGERVLYEGISPVEPMSSSSDEPVTVTAHTYDWYVPEATPPWAQPVNAGLATQAARVGRSEDRGTVGARSIHLVEKIGPMASAVVAQPSPARSYHHRTRDALASHTSDLTDAFASATLSEPSLSLAERRHVRAEDVTFDWQLRWDRGQLEVRLRGRPENRSCQVFVVIEEAVRSGEGFADVAWLHTPFAADLVNQLTLVPESFFDDERDAFQFGERVWDDTLRRFAESAEVGPEDPIASAVVEARRLLRESASTATLGAALDLRFDALRRHRPDLVPDAAAR